MLNPQQKLDALTQLGIDLNRIQDLDILMERILTEARRFVSADAGSIYIRDDRYDTTYHKRKSIKIGIFCAWPPCFMMSAKWPSPI